MLAGESVGIFGAAGAVGSAAAFALAQSGVAGRLVLADAAATALAQQRMDLEALTPVLPGLTVETDGVEALASCPVVVACASVAHRDGEPRTAFLAENARILGELADALAAAGWRGSVVLVSNPVDALATRLQHALGEQRATVIGCSLNDSLRLRVAIARSLGCAAADVEAWSVGEHGPHAVPLLSRVRVGGVRVVLTAAQRAQVEADVRGFYDRWQALGTGRTTVWSTAWGIATLVRALLRGDARPWPASMLLHGEYGVEGICLTAPLLFRGGRGAARVLEWRLAQREADAVAVAAEVVRAAARETTEEARCASC
jgi:malate/lactate dehydrogenase